MNDEEVIHKVNTFVKSRGSQEPLTPGEGPLGKMSETPLAKEIEALLAKEDLDEKERGRLDELLAEIDKRQKGGA